MLYILHAKSDLWDFLLSEIKCHDDTKVFEINTFYLYLRVLKRVLPLKYSKYPILYLKRIDIQKLKVIKSEDRILVLGHTSIPILSTINNVIPQETQKFLYIWNPLSSMFDGEQKIRKVINAYDCLGYKVYTFNPSDVKLYGLNLTNQIYKILPIQKNRNNYKYDFYFLGYDKDRSIDIIKFERELQRKGYKTLFIIKKPGDKLITYQENIDNIQNTKVLIDLVQKGQQGQTLRPLESIAFEKKIITNNVSIVNESFFSKENILIIDNLPLPSFFNDFVNSPYKNIPIENFSKYDINNWIDNFK